MPSRPDSRIRRTGRHPEFVIGRTNRRSLATPQRQLDDLADMLRTGPPENGVARHNFATIDDAANTLGLTAERGRVAGQLIREVAEDVRTLLDITKSAREAGIPREAVTELIRRGMDFRHRLKIEEPEWMAKAAADAVGTVRKRADGRQYRKVAEGKWVPHGEGRQAAAEQPGAGKRPAAAQPPPKGKGAAQPPPKAAGKRPPLDPTERRKGKTAQDRHGHLQAMANAAGKQIHGSFDESKHGHDHMDALEAQLKRHISDGLNGPEGDEMGPDGAPVPPPKGPPGKAAEPDEAAADQPDPAADAEAHSRKLESMHQLGSAFRTKEQKIFDRVWHGIKHTAQEFPDAAKAIGKLATGGKLNKHDMTAIVSVGSMIGTTAVVASGYGAMAGGAVLSQKFMTHVAMAALHSHLNAAYTGYAALGFVKKMAHVAEGYVHGGVAGAAYHTGEAVAEAVSEGGLHKADKPNGDAEGAGDAEMKKLAKGMIREMAKILDHDWTPEEITAAEAGAEGLSENGDEDGAESDPAAESPEGDAQDGDPSAQAGPGDADEGDGGDEDAPDRPTGHDAPEQPHEQHRQTQEVHDLITKLDAMKPRLDSAHQKAMCKELREQAEEVAKDPSPQAIEWISKRIDSFTHLVSGISGDGSGAESADNGAKPEPPTKKALLLDPTSGRVLLKAGGAGSRGGHVIGHTGSGKAIYAHKKPQHYRRFTKQDHVDASRAHGSRLDEAEDRQTSSDPDLRSGAGDDAAHHLNRKMGHEKWARMGANYPEPKAEKSQIQAAPPAVGATRGIAKAGGGWQNIPGGRHGGQRRRARSGGWEYSYGAHDAAKHAARPKDVSAVGMAILSHMQGRVKVDIEDIYTHVVDDFDSPEAEAAGNALAKLKRKGLIEDAGPGNIKTTARGDKLARSPVPNPSGKTVKVGRDTYTRGEAERLIEVVEARQAKRRERERTRTTPTTWHEERNPPGAADDLFLYQLRAALRKADDAGGEAVPLPANEDDDASDDEVIVRPVGFGVPMTKALTAGHQISSGRKVPPPPPPPRKKNPAPALSKGARAAHPVNVHGHRDALAPGMLLHPRDRHSDAGTIEVLADGRFKVGDDIVKGGHALLTTLYGSQDHRMTVRRYFKLGGERQAIPRADVTDQLRRLLKADAILVQRSGQEYHLTGDLVKAGVPDYMRTTGDLSATIDREAAFDLCRMLGARNG